MPIHVYLSPHLDDAALSAAGLIANQKAKGESVEVINIFAGIPNLAEYEFSEFAQIHHKKWNIPPLVAVAQRRKEDEKVLESLGARVENLDFYDAIYRKAYNKFLYTNEKELFGLVCPEDQTLIENLDKYLTTLYEKNHDANFYAPLGIGGHVDHAIVRNNAIKIHHQGAQVVFYEDFPYVARKGWKYKPRTAEEAIKELPFKFENTLVTIDVEKKIKILSGYKSQMFSLFGEEKEKGLAKLLHEYSTSLTQDKKPYEQYWKISKPIISL